MRLLLDVSEEALLTAEGVSLSFCLTGDGTLGGLCLGSTGGTV